jgi:hypothetical protein
MLDFDLLYCCSSQVDETGYTELTGKSVTSQFALESDCRLHFVRCPLFSHLPYNSLSLLFLFAPSPGQEINSLSELAAALLLQFLYMPKLRCGQKSWMCTCTIGRTGSK